MLKFSKFTGLIILFLLIQINYSYSMKEQVPFDHSHSVFDSLLKSNVKDGKVDYMGFIDSSDEFSNYLQSLANVTPEHFNGWTDNQKVAFWINAYNAFTVKAIIDNYPIKMSFTFVGIFYAPKNSILQIPGVWKKLKFKAVGEDVTLDHIEHGILRVEFNEPRIHAAINCASIGCPDLRNEAYTADKLDSQLDSASINFVNNPGKGVLVSPDGKTVKVSKIFKWFGEDFYENYKSENFADRKKRDNGVLGFVAVYIQDEDTKSIIQGNDFKLKHLHYDWNLNEE